MADIRAVSLCRGTAGWGGGGGQGMNIWACVRVRVSFQRLLPLLLHRA